MAGRVNWKQRALNAERALAEIRAVLGTFDLIDDVAAMRTSNKPKQHPDTKQAIDHFHRRYLRAYNAKPTWDGKTTKLVDELVRKHGIAEFEQRCDNMFGGALDWLSQPYTVSALRQHFDRLVVVNVADVNQEWSKVQNMVRLFGSAMKHQHMRVTKEWAELDARTRSIIQQWGWRELCQTHERFAKSEFVRRWSHAQA